MALKLTSNEIVFSDSTLLSSAIVRTEQFANNSITTDKFNFSNSDISLNSLQARIYRPGEVIEQVSGLCDGSTITVKSGQYTIQNVPESYVGSADNFTDVPGSTIAYVPPPQTTKVIYQFYYMMRWETDWSPSSHRFLIDNNEVTEARFNRSNRYAEERSNFEWIIKIGSGDNPDIGSFLTWNTLKTLKLQWRSYGTGTADGRRSMMGTNYWNGGGAFIYNMPSLNIIAIA